MPHVARSLRIPCAATALLVAGMAVAGAQEWKKMSYDTDRFEVEFLGDAVATPSPVNEETRKLMHRAVEYMNDGGDQARLVVVGHYKYGVRFPEAVKAATDSLRCQRIVTDVALSIADGQGRDFKGTQCTSGLNAQARFVVRGNWFYQAITTYMPKDGADATATRFVQSFKLLPPN